MMEIQDLIDEYISFIKKGISYRKLETGYEITTPFLNDCNDHIQIYIQDIEKDQIIFSDGGDTLSYLSEIGISYTGNRKNIIQAALRSYGVEIDKDECLTIKASVRNAPQQEHNLIQAILKINDMEFTTKSRVSSMFADDVAAYFEKHEIYAMTGMSVMGKSTLYHTYDFLIGRDKYFPERFCNVVNNPTRNSIINTIFSWNDTSGKRRDDSRFYVFLNDEKKINSDVFTALDEYKIGALPKSQMDTKETLKLFKNVG